MQGIHMEDYYRLLISPIKKNRLINKNYVPMPKVNNKISINLFENTSAINEQSEKKKNNIDNKSISNFSNNNNDMSEINNNNETGGNNKFRLSFDNFEDNEGENSNKKEMLGKKTKKGKNNKHKKNKNNTNNNANNDMMNLDE